MLPPILLILGLAAARPAPADEPTAWDLYEEGRAAEKAGHITQAFLLYARAAALEPHNPKYWQREQALQTRAALESKLMPALAPGLAGLGGDEIPPISPATARDLADARQPLPPTELSALPGIRDFDLRMAQESHRRLEEIPGWWEDERIVGTPLEGHLRLASDPASTVLRALRPEPWLEPPGQRRVRFRALYLLLSKRATPRTAPGQAGLGSEEMRVLLRLAFSGALEHTNIAEVSLPAIRRGFERLLAREDTREMLDSLLLHIGAAYETEIWGQVRRFIVLDAINDLLALTIRSSLLHLMSAD